MEFFLNKKLSTKLVNSIKHDENIFEFFLLWWLNQSKISKISELRLIKKTNKTIENFPYVNLTQNARKERNFNATILATLTPLTPKTKHFNPQKRFLKHKHLVLLNQNNFINLNFIYQQNGKNLKIQ